MKLFGWPLCHTTPDIMPFEYVRISKSNYTYEFNFVIDFSSVLLLHQNRRQKKSCYKFTDCGECVLHKVILNYSEGETESERERKVDHQFDFRQCLIYAPIEKLINVIY